MIDGPAFSIGRHPLPPLEDRARELLYHSDRLAHTDCSTLDLALDAFGFPDPISGDLNLLGVDVCDDDLGNHLAVEFTITERLPGTYYGYVQWLQFGADRRAAYGDFTPLILDADVLCCDGSLTTVVQWGERLYPDDCRWRDLPRDEYDTLFEDGPPDTGASSTGDTGP